MRLHEILEAREDDTVGARLKAALRVMDQPGFVFNFPEGTLLDTAADQRAALDMITSPPDAESAATDTLANTIAAAFDADREQLVGGNAMLARRVRERALSLIDQGQYQMTPAPAGPASDDAEVPLARKLLRMSDRLVDKTSDTELVKALGRINRAADAFIDNTMTPVQRTVWQLAQQLASGKKLGDLAKRINAVEFNDTRPEVIKAFKQQQAQLKRLDDLGGGIAKIMAEGLNAATAGAILVLLALLTSSDTTGARDMAKELLAALGLMENHHGA